MNRDKRIMINKAVDAILEEYEISHPIDDFEKIIIKMNGELIFSEQAPSEEGMVKKLKQADKHFQIMIDGTMSKKRKNFTIAHELGHLFLHMGYRNNNELWDKQEEEFFRQGNTEKEYEAHEFAAAFLMPQNLYSNFIYSKQENGKIDMENVASHFNVSTAAASNRGKWLGIIAW